MPMQHQLTGIALLRRRHGEPRKTLFQQQLQQQFGVAPVGLLLARGRRPHAGGIADPQLVATVGQQPFEPARAARGLHTDAHRLALPTAVKLLGLAAVLQAAITAFAGGGVTKSDLLKARMKITTYNQHRVDSFLPSLVVRTTKILARRESTLSCNQDGARCQSRFAPRFWALTWDWGTAPARRDRAGSTGADKVSDLPTRPIHLALFDGQTALQHHLDRSARAQLNFRTASQQNGGQAESTASGRADGCTFTALLVRDGSNAGSRNRQADNRAHILC